MCPKFIINNFVISSFLVLGHFAFMLHAQQQYSGESVFDCNATDKTGPSPAFLYACNGPVHSCQAFLIFRSQPPHDSPTNISKLTSSALPELSRLNNISVLGQFPLNSEVIVPVNCSCSGQYYQAETSYVIQSEIETYYTISNNTFEGLATCNALIQENPYNEYDLQSGMKLRVPLRCACPTKNQTSQGIKFLLTYLVTWNDDIRDLSQRFNMTSRSIADANGFSEEDAMLYPFTTLLIPLSAVPSISQIEAFSPPPASSPPSTIGPSPEGSRKGMYIGIAVGSSLGALACFLCLLLFCFRRGYFNKSSQKNKREKEIEHLTENIKKSIHKFDLELKIYSFDELDAATEGFCVSKKLGESVYRGILRNKSVAIKKMSRDVRKEVKILQKINHFNLISLYGVCQHNAVYYLAYEFMEYGSLQQWLNQESCPEVQSWNIRIRMALDIANGLDYLHNFTSPGYVHKDINGENILVNGDLRAKIGNFSFAKSSRAVEIGSSVSSSAFIPAKKGYRAPDYLETRKATPKVDVYAFGVVLLELVTGRDAFYEEEGREVLLSDAALSAMSSTNAKAAVAKLIVPNLQERHPLGYTIDRSGLILRLIEISVACLAMDPSRRPTMAAVISRLSKIQLDVNKSEYSFSDE